MEQKTFDTLDVYVAAYLKAHGIVPSIELQKGRSDVIFSFASSPRTDDLILDYSNNCHVKVLDYAVAVKFLRGRMLDLKHSVPR